MRFVITAILVMGLVVMTTMDQKNELISLHENSLSNFNPDYDYIEDPSIEHEKNTDPWQTLKKTFNKILIFALAGWAFGRLFMQFRRVILFFFGQYIIINFLLMLTGLVEFKFQWALIEPIFQTAKMAIINVGFASFVSILFGIWFGVKGFPS